MLFIKCTAARRSEGTRKIKKAGSNLLLVTLFLYLALVIVGSCDNDISRDVAFSVYGYVTDAQNQEAIADAEVFAGDLLIDSTDTAGYYQYTSWGGGKHLQIIAKAEGYLPSHKEVFVHSGSRVRVDFALSKQ